MKSSEFLNGLVDFLSTSPSPWHAVSNMAAKLKKAGFTQLSEGADWKIKSPGRYFVTRNDSSIIAFVNGKKNIVDHGMRMVGAHTDSPCLRVKPNPEHHAAGLSQLGVEPYGGVLMNPWFDRDLSMAGRVSYKTAGGAIANALLDFQRPVAVIPSLAIHLDREANKSRSINAQRHLPPVLCHAAQHPASTSKKREMDFRDVLLKQLKKEHRGIKTREILEYEICLYDQQAAAVVGLENEFLMSARLDNLMSCWVGLTAMLEAPDTNNTLLVATDHEEVGSSSACGAQGPFLRAVLERLTGDIADYTRAIDRSVMISADNAHALHPNFSDKHDPRHAPLINAGPVLKVNNNQRYASNSETSALFKTLCAEAKVPMQTMVARSDMGCGTTIGPITATEVGVPTVDVGVPQLGMHSIREMCGTEDGWHLNRALKKFFTRAELLTRS